MKYCIKCGSHLEEHSLFCFSCGTPVEEDGIFYEEEFYLPKKVFRGYKKEALETRNLSKDRNSNIRRIAVLVLLIVLLSIGGIALYRSDIFSSI